MRVVLRVCLPSSLLTRLRQLRDRRRNPRYEASSLGSLFWQASDGEWKRTRVALRNWSEAGLQVEVPHEIPVKVRVQFADKHHGYLGLSRYCQSVGQSYRIGIQVTRSFRTEES